MERKLKLEITLTASVTDARRMILCREISFNIVSKRNLFIYHSSWYSNEFFNEIFISGIFFLFFFLFYNRIDFKAIIIYMRQIYFFNEAIFSRRINARNNFPDRFIIFARAYGERGEEEEESDIYTGYYSVFNFKRLDPNSAASSATGVCVVSVWITLFNFNESRGSPRSGY